MALVKSVYGEGKGDAKVMEEKKVNKKIKERDKYINTYINKIRK